MGSDSLFYNTARPAVGSDSLFYNTARPAVGSDSLFYNTARPAVGSDSLFLYGYIDQGVKLTSHLHRLPRLRMSGVKPLFPYMSSRCVEIKPYIHCNFEYVRRQISADGRDSVKLAFSYY